MLPFEKNLQERFFNSFNPSSHSSTEMFYTFMENPGTIKETGGLIHIHWNTMVGIYWGYFNAMRIRYYIIILLGTILGFFLGKII